MRFSTGVPKMSLKVCGPIIFSTLLFIIGGTIKIVAFNQNIIFEIPPYFALWSTGILFTLAVSEQTLFRGKPSYQISRTPSGSGIIIEYSISLPDDLDFSPKFLYFFVGSMMIWILSILFSGLTAQLYTTLNHWNSKISILYLINFSLSGLSIGIALRSLLEVP